MHKFTIQFASAEDAAIFSKYMERTAKTDATVGGPIAAMLCSALKRAKVKHHKTKHHEATT